MMKKSSIKKTDDMVKRFFIGFAFSLRYFFFKATKNSKTGDGSMSRSEKS